MAYGKRQMAKGRWGEGEREKLLQSSMAFSFAFFISGNTRIRDYESTGIREIDALSKPKSCVVVTT
jgi:hypothetical protein